MRKTCPVCGVVFEARRARYQTCGRPCGRAVARVKIRAWRARFKMPKPSYAPCARCGRIVAHTLAAEPYWAHRAYCERTANAVARHS